MPPVGDQARRGLRHRAFRGSARPRARPPHPRSGGADLDVAVAGFGRGRLHAEGHDVAGAGGRGGGLQRRSASAGVVGDGGIGGHHPQHRIRVGLGDQHGGGGDRRGAVAADRFQHDAGVVRCRRRAVVRRSGTGAPGCRRRWAARTPGPAARSAVSCIIVRSDTSGQSCFGKLSRDTGHSRVPEPPERITGTMRCVVMTWTEIDVLCCPISRLLPS